MSRLEALGFNANDLSKEDLIFLAKTAENAERFEDMCEFMDTLVRMGGELGIEGRNLLSVAFKNVIGARRASWRTLCSEEGTSEKLIEEYKAQLQEELDHICKRVISLLENNLIKEDEENEGQVFYLKMAADYYRYLAECETSNEPTSQKAADKYHQAYNIAQVKMQPTHPIRLGLALNYSVCLYEIMKDEEKACLLAKDAFDEAISKLDLLDDTDYKDSTLIMQLLRDNLTLWSSKDDLGDDDEN
jgi:hypothetical protein